MNPAITVPLVYALMVWTGKALHLFALMPYMHCIYLYSNCRMQSKLAVQCGRPSAYWPCCIDFLSQQICHSVITIVFFKSLFRAVLDVHTLCIKCVRDNKIVLRHCHVCNCDLTEMLKDKRGRDSQDENFKTCMSVLLLTC
jgi:hypothetical protein